MIHSTVMRTADETVTKGITVLKCGIGECVMATLCYSLAEESNTALVSLRKWCPKELQRRLCTSQWKRTSVLHQERKRQERKRHFYLKVSQIIFNLQSHLSLNGMYTDCQFRSIEVFCGTGMRFKMSDRNYSHLSLLLTSILKHCLPQIWEIN